MTFLTLRREVDRFSDLAAGSPVVSGVVELGDQRGRTLGFPTANLAIGEGSASDGVWAGWLQRGHEERYLAAISIGRRPTFYGRDGIRLLEAHVLDFAGDLYGSLVDVGLGMRIRSQRRFASIDELVARLDLDIEETRRWGRSTAR
jgi:riboflavin kinase/FMN adenylyltransferase